MVEKTTGITITGVKEVVENLKKISKECTKDVFWELFRFCQNEVIPNVQRYASQGAMTEESEPFPLGSQIPVSGYLASSIGITSGGEEYEKRNIKIFSTATYSKAQEFGWFMTKEQAQVLAIQRRKMGIEIPPTGLNYPHWVQHPFLRPGVNGKIEDMVETLKEFTKKKLG